MTSRLFMGTALAFALTTSALAQGAYGGSGNASSPATPSGNSSMGSSMGAHHSSSSGQMDQALRQKLTRGAEIHDASGKVVATVTTVRDDGNVLIRESTGGAGPSPSIDRVLPASSISWTNNRLVTNMTADAIGKLPSGT